ncbi:hypothetical protein ACPPVQ_00180 [Diaminobutyricibacter sp. McL0618]|uniref:hypothetical protein n=1 Tax=Leifsonia sp. McL0618 TaxID=3415677 RepID=UPI003CFAA765
MPIVTVTTSKHPEVHTLLAGIADAIADALQLGEGDVIARAIDASPGVASDRSADASAVEWPIVTIHGSDRGASLVGMARSAAEAAVRQWARIHGVEIEGVWSEWIVPQPPQP